MQNHFFHNVPWAFLAVLRVGIFWLVPQLPATADAIQFSSFVDDITGLPVCSHRVLESGFYAEDSSTISDDSLAQRIEKYFKQANVLMQEGHHLKAEILLQKNYEFAKNIQNKRLQTNALQKLIWFNEKTGDYKAALFYLKQLDTLHADMQRQNSALVLREERNKTSKIENQFFELIDYQLYLEHKLSCNKLVIMILGAISIVFAGMFITIIALNEKRRQAYRSLMQKNLRLLSFSKNNGLKNRNINHDIDNFTQQKIMDCLLNQLYEKRVFLREDLSLSSLAKKCHTNSAYLSRIIHDKYHCHFNTYINNLRIEEAQKMMANSQYTNFTIEAIAHSVGFHSKSSFNNAFKKLSGVTPSFYLKYIRNNPENS
jgi:YesN/AraC family two-component response regulator